MTKVLIVDDDKESRELLSEVLVMHGYSVGVVESAAAARAAVDADSEYGIVIADLQMPDGGGLDLLESLRRKQSRHEIVLMSSFMSGNERKRALALGADALLDKPFKISELLEVVAGLAKERGLSVGT